MRAGSRRTRGGPPASAVRAPRGRGSRAPGGWRSRPLPRRPRPAGGDLQVNDVGGIEQPRRLGWLVGHPGDDRPFLGRGRIVDRDPHQEPVALRLGERIDALRLDRVLGGHDQERLRHREGATSDGDLSLRHRLEQRRLDPRGCAIDLVDQDQVGHDRPGFDVEDLRRGPEDPRPDDVGRDQVRRELDAIEGAAEDPRQRRQQQRLARARERPPAGRARLPARPPGADRRPDPGRR